MLLSFLRIIYVVIVFTDYLRCCKSGILSARALRKENRYHNELDKIYFRDYN